MTAAPTKQLPDLTDEQKARCLTIADMREYAWTDNKACERSMQEGFALGQQTARDVQAAALVVAEANGYAAGKAYQASLAARDVQAEAVGYVACRQCDECGHVGINDDHDTDAACGECGWAGESPAQDHCPECNRDGTMAAACPKCSGYYSLLADAHLPAPVAAPPASDVQPVGAVADRMIRFPAWDVIRDLCRKHGCLYRDPDEEGVHFEQGELFGFTNALIRLAVELNRAAAPALQGESGATCDLRNAAQALVDRWDTPLWKDVPHTGEFIAALRRTLVPHPAAAQDAAGEQS